MYRKSSKKVTKPSSSEVAKSSSNNKINNIKQLPRRKLKNDNLNLMLQSSEYLLEDFIELEAQYIGRLKQIPKKIDVTIKSVLLNLMKDAQNHNNLPKVLTLANDSIIRINAYILEILTRDNENLINAIPVHSISNVCYAKEAENSHIVVFQSGDTHENTEFYDLIIIMLNTKEEAETICKLLQKCFEQLLIEKTMSLLDQVIGDETASNCSTSISVAIRNKKNGINKNLNDIKVQNIDDVRDMVNNSLNRPPKVDQRKPSVKQINKSSIVTPNETIEDFIIQLQNELTKKEYEEFGLSLAQWQKGLPFDRFCNKALSIIGTNRLHILVALKPFVPQENLEWFEKFLKINDSEQMFSLDVYSSTDDSVLGSSIVKNQEQIVKPKF